MARREKLARAAGKSGFSSKILSLSDNRERDGTSWNKSLKWGKEMTKDSRLKA